MCHIIQCLPSPKQNLLRNISCLKVVEQLAQFDLRYMFSSTAVFQGMTLMTKLK